MGARGLGAFAILAFACVFTGECLAVDPPRIVRPQEKVTGSAPPRFVPLKPAAKSLEAEPEDLPSASANFTPFLTPTAVPPTPVPPPASSSGDGARYILVPILPAGSAGAPIDWRSPDTIRSLRFRMVTDDEMTRIRELADRLRSPKGATTFSAGAGVGTGASPDEPIELPDDALVMDPSDVPREMEYKALKPAKPRPKPR